MGWSTLHYNSTSHKNRFVRAGMGQMFTLCVGSMWIDEVSVVLKAR